LADDLSPLLTFLFTSCRLGTESRQDPRRQTCRTWLSTMTKFLP